jgi:hypothetical protein
MTAYHVVHADDLVRLAATMAAAQTIYDDPDKGGGTDEFSNALGNLWDAVQDTMEHSVRLEFPE